MKRYANTFKTNLVWVEDTDLMLSQDMYVFNQDFIDESGIDKYIGEEFWVIPCNRGNRRAFPNILVKDKYGVHFDDELMENVHYFVLKEKDDTEEYILDNFHVYGIY